MAFFSFFMIVLNVYFQERPMSQLISSQGTLKCFMVFHGQFSNGSLGGSYRQIAWDTSGIGTLSVFHEQLSNGSLDSAFA